MTRDDIIRMARDDARWGDAAYAFANDLERFAKLVSAAEREAIAADWEKRHGFDMHGVAVAIRARSTP